jgi:hypothetical protein
MTWRNWCKGRETEDKKCKFGYCVVSESLAPCAPIIQQNPGKCLSEDMLEMTVQAAKDSS